ncbi:MAG: DUF29 domain-containing protein [Candidatus Magnetoovum sp. WYHC-5]|nr:DUF29 domain-containing protein [Candidatus Magnetoovum sp. WYHC-5]
MDNPNTITHTINTATEQSLYERDFYQWALHNAAMLRQGKLTEIDVGNIAEEIESMGRGEKKELINRLAILMMHLLKLQYQPQKQKDSNSWVITIMNQRTDISFIFEDNPSLRHELDAIIEKAFKRAMIKFRNETGISQKHLPLNCPYSFEQIMDDEFWPEETII